MAARGKRALERSTGAELRAPDGTTIMRLDVNRSVEFEPVGTHPQAPGWHYGVWCQELSRDAPLVKTWVSSVGR